MDIIDNPPKVGKNQKIDHEFSKWWLFLNSWGVAAFIFFLSCLGLNEHKHSCALLSCILLAWGYVIGQKEFPEIITKLRKKKNPNSKALEKKIWHEHLAMKFLYYIPLFLGIFTLGSLAFWPAFNGRWSVYLSFFN